MEFKKLLKKRSGNQVLHRLNMDMMFEAYLTHEHANVQQDDIPQTKDPVWILGKKYNAMKDFELIRRDIRSRLWFTYRKGFVPIGDSGLTSDKGWGCMLRCGQMLLSQALLFLHLGRDWEWNVGSKEGKYMKIVRMFEDRRTAPYSIHQIALTGASEGKQVGDWFGPNTVAQVLKKLAVYDEWSSLVIHVALDNTIVVNDIKKLCKLEGRGLSWKPLVLIVPLRLGINEINPVYVKALKICFTFSQSLGVIGGRPNHALYFVGTVGDDVIFLDPHTTQSIGVIENRGSINQEDAERKWDSSYHCLRASRLHILHMDPSVAAGFLCKTEGEFDLLCMAIREKIMPEKEALFEVRDERERQWTPVGEQAEEAASALVSGWDRHFDDSDEDFELLG